MSVAEQVALLNGVLALGLGAAVLWLLLQLLGQQGRLLLRLDALETRLGGRPPSAAGLPVGAPAPAFSLPDLDGETRTLDALRAPGRPVLLLFADPNCGPCAALLPDLVSWQREHAARLTLALISRGTPEANRAKLAADGLIAVLLQQDREVATAYQAHATPSAVVVRPDGTIGSPPTLGAEAIWGLLMQAIGQATTGPGPIAIPAPIISANGAHGRCPHCGQAHGHGDNGHGGTPTLSPPPALPIGAPAPAFTLPDLTGRAIELASLRGHPTLVLFWNPSCGFCAQMLPDLRTWEADPPPGAPQLLVVSTGSMEANQALGLRSPVVLDPTFTVGRAFGAAGTPSAVLVDAEGHVASSVAVGAHTILALAAAPQGEVVSQPEHTERRPIWTRGSMN